jgi:hypothetical protein
VASCPGGKDLEITNHNHTRTDSTDDWNFDWNFDWNDSLQNAGPASMFPGVSSFGVPDEPTINPSLFMPAVNGDSMTVSTQGENLKFPQSKELSSPLDYSPVLLSGTGFAPYEHAAVCTDDGTVGHEYPGDDKIPQCVLMPSSQRPK